MKKKRTLIYTILLGSSLLLCPLHTKAQGQKPAATDEKEEIPFYQGTSVGVDIAGIGSKLLGSDITSAEVSVEVNLKNRFMPVVEIGYGQTDTTDDETNIHYKAAAPYFRIGMNYNVMFKKPHLPGFVAVGLRYGFTSFSYDVDALDMVDPTWGNITVPFAYNGVKTNVSWVEAMVGFRTRVYKSFSMGWSVRYRARISMKKTENTEPWYIPGFGKNNSTNIGLTYNLIYKLPF
ncbi:DUF6048 family protein [Phocaeicola sp.]